MQALVMSYLKNTDPTWGWAFTVLCGENYNATSPKALLEALQTAVTSQVLVPLLFRDQSSTMTKYVKITGFNGLHGTGGAYLGKYAVSVIEP
jgi:hypothetical protein